MFSRSVLAPFITYRTAENQGITGILGAHVMISALGIIAAGLFWARIAGIASRKVVVFYASTLLAVGALGLGSTYIPLSFASAFLLGASGSVLNITLQSALSDEHGKNRRIALGEAAVVSSLFGAAAPFVIAACARVPVVGWRAGLIVPLVLLLCLVPLVRRTRIPEYPHLESQANSKRTRKSLPTIFWTWVLLLFLCSATEWAVIYWGAAFLHQALGVPVDLASVILGTFLGVEILGKALWSFFSHRFSTVRLMIVGIFIGLVGILCMMLSTHLSGAPVVAVVSLMIFGIGISGTSQLGTSAALALPKSLSTIAMSRISLSTGLSVVLFPFLIGLIAQTTGILDAFVVPLVTCSLALIVSILVKRQRPET